MGQPWLCFFPNFILYSHPLWLSHPPWLQFHKSEMSILRPVGLMQLRMAMNAAHHKITNLLKTLWDFFVITCHNVFNVWPKTTLLLPVWPRDAKSLDAPTHAFLPLFTFSVLISLYRVLFPLHLWEISVPQSSPGHCGWEQIVLDTILLI